MSKKDPTLGEFFDFVKEKFEMTEEKFVSMEQRFVHLEQRIDVRFKGVNDRMDSIDARLGVLQRDSVKMENLAYLLKYDTVYGRAPFSVKV